MASSGRDLSIVDILRVPEATQVKNRLHLDLRADETSFDAEVDRLEGLVARRVDVGQGPDVTWVAFADPGGNELSFSAAPGRRSCRPVSDTTNNDLDPAMGDRTARRSVLTSWGTPLLLRTDLWNSNLHQ